MPTSSLYPDVEIPNDDLWSFMFEQPKEFSVHQVIYSSAVSSRSSTFQDVKELSTAFGQALRCQWNWREGEVLLLYAPNDIDTPPITLGVLWAGGVVSPANPAYSVGEPSFQLTNSKAKAIVTTTTFLPRALIAAKHSGVPTERILLLGPEEQDESVGVKHWKKLIAQSCPPSSLDRAPTVSNTDLAFLVYSSGTTGLPKGVMLTHRNLVAQLLMIKSSAGRFYSSGFDKILGTLPFFHIYGLTALVLQSLHRGIELVVMPAFDLGIFCKTIQDRKITFTYVAPPVMVRLARDKDVESYDLSSLKMITCGAAPLSKELVEIVYKKLGVKASQAYGLSETSPISHMQSWDEWYTSAGSVGKLLPNMTAKCMSSGESPMEVAPNRPGELWLRGPSVFKGYWQNDEATANCLTADGFFKTGDVGYTSPSGDFYITDRVKELIKYKGFQVAPAELEGKLMDHPNIRDVAVIGVEDRAQHTEVPRAYVVVAEALSGTSSGGDEAREIQDWLAERVAHHKKLRGGVRFVQEIPKSATGKILRRVLKDMAKREDAKPRARF